LALAAVCGFSTAALVCARSASPLATFCVVSGATALCLLPLLASVDSVRAQSRGVLAALVGVGLATGPLSVLGRVLKSTTHHRPLGAVTFAFLALFVVLGALSCTLRLLLLRPSRAIERVLLVLSLVSGVSVLLPLILSPSTRGGVVDVALALGSGALALLVPWPERVRAHAERAGPWLWAFVVIVGFVSAQGPARAVAAAASPALSAVFTWF